MGLTYADTEISNARKVELASIKTRSLVDSGSLMLCIPQHLAIQLELDELEKREVFTADGSSHLVPYVGPVKVQFQNRFCFTGAMVIGDEVLLGAVPMEDMDVMLHPSTMQLIINPYSPNKPSYKIK